MRYRRSLAALIVLLPALAFWIGTRAPQQQADDDFYLMRKNFELFGAIYEEIVTSYMDRVDPERFMRAGVEAMLEELDPWTLFHDEAFNTMVDIQGRRMLGRVGLNLGIKGGRVTVVAPDEAASAYQQGMRTGDVLLRVGGSTVDSLSVPQVHSLLDGEPGSIVDVRALRGVDTLSFSLLREPPQARSVSFAERIPGTDYGLIKLEIFGNGASGEIAEAITAMQAERPLEGIVLDLRGNPGGLLNEAIGISQLFVPNGSPVVSTRGRGSEGNRLYRTSSDPIVPDLPLAVLMNAFSASASEIVAGVVQDLDRGVVIGDDSYGKGLVQQYRQLPYNTSMRVTISRYYTPSGRGIRKDALEFGDGQIREFKTQSGRVVREGRGIEPDIRIAPQDAGTFEEALNRQSAFFRFAGMLVTERGTELEAAQRAAGRITLPDDAVTAFRDWLEDQDFQYRTPLEDQVAQLESEEHTDAVRRALVDLRQAARAERESLFDRHEERLRDRLREEVSSRLLGPSDQVRAAIPEDIHMQAALDVLGSVREYRQILTPQ